MKEPIYTNYNGKVKVYQLDFKIRNCAVGTKTIKEHGLMLLQFRNGFEIDEDATESIDKIAISDAFSHDERLVFPAFWIKNKETGERKICWSHAQIDGKWTMKMYGGDRKAMYHTETYIRHLKAINKGATE